MIDTKINSYDDIADMYNLAMTFGYYDFSLNQAPKIINFYKNTDIYKENKDVLDLGCGTGLISILFLENGFNVTGIDLSEGMIRNAKINLKKYKKENIDFFVGNATNFKFNKKFGLVVSLFSVMNHLDNINELKKAFHCVNHALEVGGYFVFDVFTDKYFDNLKPVQINEYSVNKYNVFFSREVANKHELRKTETKVTCFFKEKDSQLYNKYTNSVTFQRWNIDTLINAIKESGFGKIEIINTSEFEKIEDSYDKHEQIFIIAKKL
jgi:SAM-dependent methyltransferase